jgi:hypothetical protein
LPEKDEDMQTIELFNLPAPSAPCTFHKGDRVYLAKGPYQGTAGTFLNLRNDPKWADILEANSTSRAHPVEWMALSAPNAQP